MICSEGTCALLSPSFFCTSTRPSFTSHPRYAEKRNSWGERRGLIAAGQRNQVTSLVCLSKGRRGYLLGVGDKVVLRPEVEELLTGRHGEADVRLLAALGDLIPTRQPRHTG